MKYKTRKLIFSTLVAVLASFLFTCIPFGPPDYEDEDEITYTDVEYSQDGSTVTIYLDGSAPVRHSRALTRDLAILGHDLFEVAFAYKNAGGQVAVARAVWETGHAAGINGIYREGAGVDYSNVRLVSTMSNNSGSAILLVGKKSDRTLLAVGKLAQVDGIGSPGNVPNITRDTKTVTFSVAALRAGTNSNKNYSSFLTDATVPTSPSQNTWDYVGTTYTKVDNVIIGDRPFPLFWLDPSPRYVHGEYQFDDVTGNFNEYRNGILQKSNIELLYPTVTPHIRIPRYPFVTETGVYGGYRTSLDNSIVQVYEVDNSTSVTAPTSENAAAGTPFNNPVRFTIGQTSLSMEKRVFAFTFQIPVYPLTNLDGRNTGFSWFLRPGYDSYNYDLDDGMGGTGGAILLGTGNFETVNSSALYVNKPPDKTRYNGSGTFPWRFTSENIEVYLRTGNSVEKITTNMWFVVTTSGGERALLDGNDSQAILAAAEANGIVTVTIEYYPTVPDGEDDFPFTTVGSAPNAYGVRNSAYDGSLPRYTTTFNIYYLNLPAGVNFDAPTLNRYAITNSEDFNRVHNGHPASGRPGISGSTGGVFLIALFNNFNFPTSINLRANYNHTIIFVAGKPDIIIGIDSGNSTIFSNANGNNFYYIGIWPFDEILSVEGMAFESYPFYINPTGTWEQVPVGPDGKPTGTNPPNNNGRWFVNGTDGTKTVYHAGVTIFNIGQLAQSPATILP